jgi:hypothetical protein
VAKIHRLQRLVKNQNLKINEDPSQHRQLAKKHDFAKNQRQKLEIKPELRPRADH